MSSTRESLLDFEMERLAFLVSFAVTLVAALVSIFKPSFERIDRVNSL